MHKPNKPLNKEYMAAWGGLHGSIVVPVKPTKPKAKLKVTPHEYVGQIKLVAWARDEGLLLLSIPNAGKRSYMQGQKERAMGMHAGASDLLLAMPNRIFHGYFIEMKRKGAKPTELQLNFLEMAAGYGYLANWFDDWELARDSIKRYLIT